MVCKQLLYVSFDGINIKKPGKKAFLAGFSFYYSYALSSAVSGSAGSGQPFPS
jgi:hypothetical protein